jgi:hypothetical protein
MKDRITPRLAQYISVQSKAKNRITPKTKTKQKE